jgi:hypothetical protein
VGRPAPQQPSSRAQQCSSRAPSFLPLTGGARTSVFFYLSYSSRTSNRKRTQHPSCDFRDLLPVYGILGLQIGRGDSLFFVFHLKLELHHVRLSVGGRNPRFLRPVRRRGLRVNLRPCSSFW